MPSSPKRSKHRKRKTLEELPTLVYALQASDANHSYVGATNNFTRRLGEHNGLLGKKRGARYTRRVAVDVNKPNWSPIFKVVGFPNRRQALQFEKLFHRGFRGKRLVKVPARAGPNPFGTSSAARRAWHLYWALQKERFSQQKTVLTKNLRLRVEWSLPQFFKVAKRLPDWGPASVKHALV
jgi:predicted GIY-YIG superfamily endonuclease